MTSPKTVMDYLRLATQHLKSSGVASPRLDAEVLLGAVLNLERIHLYVQYDRPLVSAEVDQYRSYIARRAGCEPIAYIVGKKQFRSLDFVVDERVLIPRPETELLVEKAVEQLKTRYGGDVPLRVADVGTGSGAIAVAMANELPQLTVVATDVDAAALEVARHNVTTHGVTDRVECRCGDLLVPVLEERFHAIVSNPPYIDANTWKTLQKDVRDFEPERALLADEGGLAVLKTLMAEAPRCLLPGGFVVLEIGFDQGPHVRSVAEAIGYDDVRIVQDWAGHDRIAFMVWKGSVR